MFSGFFCTRKFKKKLYDLQHYIRIWKSEVNSVRCTIKVCCEMIHVMDVNSSQEQVWHLTIWSLLSTHLNGSFVLCVCICFFGQLIWAFIQPQQHEGEEKYGKSYILRWLGQYHLGSTSVASAVAVKGILMASLQ